MNNDHDSIEEWEESEAEASPLDLPLSIDALKKRCVEHEIQIRIQKRSDNTDYAYVDMKCGRETRAVYIGDAEKANSLLAIDFEKITYLSGLEAICCYEDKSIEAAFISAAGPTTHWFDRIRKELAAPNNPLDELVFEPGEAADTTQPTIAMGTASARMKALCQRFSAPLTLKIKNINVSQHDAAVKSLIKFSNSLFFQISILYGVSFILQRERRLRPGRGFFGSRPRRTIEYPKAEFDAPALSLYWYAQSARGMPLLQFLALYQVVEFFFPRYSRFEARRKLSFLLKDPTFRSDRDDHLDRLMAILSVNRSGSIGDERAQLRAVIAQCVSEFDLRAFLTADEERAAYLGGSKNKKGYHKIPIQNVAADLRNDVAERIYDIRCRIVHTKSNAEQENIEMILPFSADADALIYDIELVEYISRSVLVASSTPLR